MTCRLHERTHEHPNDSANDRSHNPPRVRTPTDALRKMTHAYSPTPCLHASPEAFA
jgi:hypothetical protein